MIDKLQQIVAQALALDAEFQKLDAEHTQIWQAVSESEDVAEVRALAQRGRALEPAFQRIADAAVQLSEQISTAFDQAEAMIAEMREQAETAVSDSETWAQDRAEEASFDPDDWETWADEREAEAAPEQLSRRSRRVSFQIVG